MTAKKQVTPKSDAQTKPETTPISDRDAVGVTWSSTPPGYSKKGVKQDVKVS